MKTDTVYKRAFNRRSTLLQRFEGRPASLGERSPGTARMLAGPLSGKFCSILGNMDCSMMRARRRVSPGSLVLARFPEAETIPMAAQVEKRFMEWMLRDNARPGTAINELELARQFGVATTGIRRLTRPRPSITLSWPAAGSAFGRGPVIVAESVGAEAAVRKLDCRRFVAALQAPRANFGAGLPAERGSIAREPAEPRVERGVRRRQVFAVGREASPQVPLGRSDASAGRNRGTAHRRRRRASRAAAAPAGSCGSRSSTRRYAWISSVRTMKHCAGSCSPSPRGSAR